MKLFLIRHTSVDSPKGLCYGQTDVGLSSTFPVEAEMVQSSIDDIRLDAVFSSPLKRCTRLAARIARDCGYRTDPRLMELNFGHWEGKYWNEISALPGSEKWFNDFWTEACPGGESGMEMIQRIRSFISDNLENTDFKQVAIVTHGGPIRAFAYLLDNLPLKDAFKWKIEPGNIFEVTTREKQMI